MRCPHSARFYAPRSLEIDSPIPPDLAELISPYRILAIREYARSGISNMRIFAHWGGNAPSLRRAVRPNASSNSGRIRIYRLPLPSEMIDVVEIGTDTWIAQFVYGRPTTGFISQSGVSPSKNESIAELYDRSNILFTAYSRFDQRTEQQNSPRQQFTRGDTMRGRPRWFSSTL